MKKWNRVCAVLCAVILMLTVGTAGCSKKAEIDPEQVTDAVMKLALQGDVEDYVALSGEDAAEVEKEYNEMLKEFSEEFVELGFSSEFSENYVEMAKKMLASGKYEILDSLKDEEDNYTVDIAVYPSDLFTLTMDKVIEKALASSGTVDMDSTWEFAETAFLEAVDEAVEEQTYGEAQTFQFHLIHDEEYVYSYDPEEITQITQIMFAVPDTLMQGSGTDYGNDYLNWTSADWNAASEEEKTMCCLAIVQKISGFTDEQIAMIDPADPEIQEGIDQMKSGLDMVFSSGFNLSVGDYTTFLMDAGMTGSAE